MGTPKVARPIGQQPLFVPFVIITNLCDSFGEVHREEMLQLKQQIESHLRAMGTAVRRGGVTVGGVTIDACGTACCAPDDPQSPSGRISPMSPMSRQGTAAGPPLEVRMV